MIKIKNVKNNLKDKNILKCFTNNNSIFNLLSINYRFTNYLQKYKFSTVCQNKNENIVNQTNHYPNENEMNLVVIKNESNNNSDLTKIEKTSEIIIDRQNLKNTTLKKLNEHIPLEKIDDQTLQDMVKYKVFEDSIAPTVAKLSAKVPEIANHDKFRNYINQIIQNDLQDDLLNKEGIVILKKKTDPLIKYGIDFNKYINFNDMDY